MASRRAYTRTKAAHGKLPTGEAFEKACFLADLLDGTIEATGLAEIRNGRGDLVRLEYDDPGQGNRPIGRAR